MSYWPFSLDSKAEQPTDSDDEQLQDPSHLSTQINTRSSGLPLHPPLGAGRAQGGPRSPAALGASAATRQFFSSELVIDSPASSPSHFEDADAEVQQLVRMASSQDEIDRLTRVAEAAIAAATAATQALTAAQSRAKKPELPPFDKKNVELWVKRVEAAYQRAGVTAPKDKFAFLEPKFPVDFNVKINDYLFGVASEEKWLEFIAYLKDEFGKSRRQQTATLLSSHTRSGLKPTQFLINLKDKTKKVNLDDIYKEILIKSLPADIQHSLVDKFDDMTAEETATAADKYFDNEGRQLSTSSNSSSVNAVQPQPEQPDESPSFTPAFSDEETDVNFVSKRQFSKGNKFGGNNFRSNQRQGFSKPSSTSSFASRPNSSSTQNKGSGGATILPSGYCSYHDLYKDAAQTCLQGCRRFNQHKGRKVFAGNGQPGRRT